MIQPERTRLSAVISSTATDLPLHRKEVLEACLRQNIIPMMVEHFPASTDSASEAINVSLGLVDSADIYIGIFGYKYGYIPAGYEKSLAEMEYDRAAVRGIPCLIFIMDKDHPIKASDFETGEGAEKLREFKSRLISSHVINFFSSPVDLRAHVINSLSTIRPQLEVESRHFIKPSKRRELLRVFVASPRDVQEERSRMPKVVESLNRTLGKMFDVVIELWRWEADAPPAAGEPQALINPELDEADIVVVIFWNRFGTYTQTGATGTEEEVVRSMERWKRIGRPQVMMYFCQRLSLLDRDALRQRDKVLAFRERVESLALTVDYEEISEFEWRVRDDLFITIVKLAENR